MIDWTQPQYLKVPAGSRVKLVLINAEGMELELVNVYSPPFALDDDGCETSEPGFEWFVAFATTVFPQAERIK